MQCNDAYIWLSFNFPMKVEPVMVILAILKATDRKSSLAYFVKRARPIRRYA